MMSDFFSSTVSVCPLPANAREYSTVRRRRVWAKNAAALTDSAGTVMPCSTRAP